MAFDQTALVTAIAEGRVDETEARQLLSEVQELEVKIAKLLTPKQEVSDTQAVSEMPEVEVATEEQSAPEVASEPEVAPVEEPTVTVTGAEEAPSEEHVHVAMEGSTNCSCGLDVSVPQEQTV